MATGLHPLAGEPVPGYIVQADGSDPLLTAMSILLPLIVLGLGTLYFRLHALPEHIAHRTSRIQYEVVAVLALLALFTHVHAFWIAGLLLALVDLPRITPPLGSIARSLERIADRADLAAADGRIAEAESALRQALDELDTKAELRGRNAGTVAEREIERLRNVVTAREGAVAAARAGRQSVEAQIGSLLPAQRASAEAMLAQAETELAKTVIVAGVAGTLEQFSLRPGDIVNPYMRPAGILVPEQAGRGRIFAGFGQIEAQVMRPGMVAEATCLSKPFAIVPLVVVEKQEVIASGQVRTSDALLDPTQTARPGSVLVVLEPLYPGGLDTVPPGSFCIVNAYTSNHDRLADPGLGTAEALALHAVDTVEVVHALILRVQALLLPIRTLVLSGH